MDNCFPLGITFSFSDDAEDEEEELTDDESVLLELMLRCGVKGRVWCVIGQGRCCKIGGLLRDQS